MNSLPDVSGKPPASHAPRQEYSVAASEVARYFGGGRFAFNSPGPNPYLARRRYLLRAITLVVAGGLLTATPLALHFGLVSQSGLGWMVYWTHDHVYLALRGWLWSAWFPWGLVVWVPVLGITLLTLVETVTGISPLRRLQRGIIRFLAPRTLGAAILNSWHRWAGEGMFRARFIETAVAALVDERLSDVRLRLLGGTGAAGDGRVLARLVVLNFSLRERFEREGQIPRLVCAALDALLLLSWNDGGSQTGDIRSDFAEFVTLTERLVSHATGRGDPPEPAPQSRQFPLGWLMADALGLCTVYFDLLRGKSTSDPKKIALAFANRRLSLANVAAQLERPRRRGYLMPQVERDPQLAACAAALILSAFSGIAWLRPELVDEVAFLSEEVDRLRFAAAERDGPPHETPGQLALALVWAGNLADLALQAALVENGRSAASAIVPGPIRKQILDDHAQNWAAWRERGDLWRTVGPKETPL